MPVRTPAAARSVKRRNWSRAVPVVGSMERDTVSWTGIGEAGGRVREKNVTRVGDRTWFAIGVLAEEPQGKASPLALVWPVKGLRRQHRLFAQDTRDDRAAHDRLAVAALDC